jgi:hypothetical protein
MVDDPAGDLPATAFEQEVLQKAEGLRAVAVIPVDEAPIFLVCPGPDSNRHGVSPKGF